MPEEPWWKEEGYFAGKEIGGGLWVVFAEMITTWRIMICDPGGVHEFWCYPKGGYPIDSYVKAWEVWDDFDGQGDPRDGWVKHFPSGRRNEPVRY